MPSLSSPNVVVFITDEQPAHMTGCYGDAIARTPTMDQLAQRGALWEHAYCASPFAVPAARR